MFVFVIGMERCGTHSISNIINAACRVNYWAEHEPEPLLCREAMLQMNGENYRTRELVAKINNLEALHKKCEIVCEANHRFGFLTEYLNSVLPNSKYIWCIRNPLHTILSRISCWCHWDEILSRYPSFYQERIKTSIPKNKKPFNTFRIRPPRWDMELYEFYVWEWIATYKENRRQLALLPQKNRKIVQTEYIIRDFPEIFEFIDKKAFEITPVVLDWIQVKYDTIYNPQLKRRETIDFATKLVSDNRHKIAKSISSAIQSLNKTEPDLIEADNAMLSYLYPLL